jgi:hypothetical protein
MAISGQGGAGGLDGNQGEALNQRNGRGVKEGRRRGASVRLKGRLEGGEGRGMRGNCWRARGGVEQGRRRRWEEELTYGPGVTVRGERERGSCAGGWGWAAREKVGQMR